MQQNTSSWPPAISTIALLCAFAGCNDRSQSNVTARDGAASERAPAANSDADLSGDQLMKQGLDKLDAKKYDEAIELFTRLAEKNPTATNHAFIGDCYWKQGKLEQADVHYRRALELDPTHCGANHALGRDAVLLKRFQDAIQYLNTANEVCAGSPVYAQNLRLRVEALLELDRIEEAQSDFETLLSAYPENRNTYEAGLLVARKKGDESLAKEYEMKLNALSSGEAN